VCRLDNMDLKNFYATEWSKSKGSNLGDRSWLNKFFDPQSVEALQRGEKIAAEDKEAVALFFADVVLTLHLPDQLSVSWRHALASVMTVMHTSKE
jgi:hypothetical protein